MSVKRRAIFIFLFLTLHSSAIAAEINCLGHSFFCTTDNMYLPCYYDEVRNITVTVSDRSEACSSETFCDTSNFQPCETGIDCGGKDFFCPTTSSYMQCDLKPDGTFRTFETSDTIPCPENTYCDTNGLAACDSSVIPDPPSTTDAPTESTEAPTEPTDEPTDTTEEPIESTVEPTESTVEPTESTVEPTESTAEPTESTEEPTEPTDAPTTTAPALGELIGYTCAGSGRYPHPTDCRRYIVCVVDGSTYRNSQRQCASELVWHQDFGGCRGDTTPCDNMEFKCDTTGRFADPLNPSKYYWCLKVLGVYQAFRYSCPAGKIYDGNNSCIFPVIPASRRRRSLSEFEETTENPTESTEAPTESTAEGPTISTDDPTTAAPALGELAGYTCAGPGLYPHPTNCRRYIYCSVVGTTYKNSQRQCRNDLVYHPDFQGCKLDATPCNNMNIKCETTGRFADPLNPNKYVWCLKANGAYQAFKYSCPVGKIFDGNSACVEPIVLSAIETFAADESPNLYNSRSLSIRNGETGEERLEESGETVADHISLNSNEDASVYSRGGRYFIL